MSILNFVKKNLTTFNRNAIKKQTIDQILKSEIFNDGIVNTHRIDATNVGDFYCAPHLYFDKLKNTQLDIYDFKSTDKVVVENFKSKIINNSLIIGGGGLLNRGSFARQMQMFEKLASKGKQTVIWGAGHNEKKTSKFTKDLHYNIDVDTFGLVGTRDFSNQGEWVPCVSCMHTIFDKTYDETQEVGIVFHKKTLKNKNLLAKLNKYPSTSNTTNLEALVSFIGKSNTIVTDSYHAMYWSMLLGKKVVVIPNSSKFFDFKYTPILTTFNDFEEDLKKATSFDGLLEECRTINRKFADKVFDYLKV